MKKNKSKYAVLGILSFGPMSGYDIKKFYEQSVASFWSESYGQIYPILKRLAEEGLATKTVRRQEGKPDRHLYSITNKGRRELQQWLVEPTGRHIGRHEVILKLIFGRQISVADNIKQIRRFRDLQVKELKDVEELKQRFQDEAADNRDLQFWLIAVEYGRYVNQAYIKWAEKALDALHRIDTKTLPSKNKE